MSRIQCAVTIAVLAGVNALLMVFRRLREIRRRRLDYGCCRWTMIGRREARDLGYMKG
jgi:hypothetical protein